MRRHVEARRDRVAGGAWLALTAAACGADSGVATERADDATTQPAATAAPDETGAGHAHRHGDRRRTRARPTAPVGGTLDWQEHSEGVEVGAARGARRLRRPRRRARSSSSSPATSPTDQENKIGSLLVNPGGPGFGGSDFALYADPIYGEPLLERFDIVGWDPRGTGLSEPAIDCIDDYDRYFAGYDITPDDEAEQRADRRPRRGVRRRSASRRTRRSCPTSARTTRPATWTRSAGRSARTRSPTSGSATAASSAPRGRRCSPTPCGPPCSTAPPIPTADPLDARRCSRRPGSRPRSTTFLAQCSADDDVRLPQRRRRRGRVRRADGRARRAADPQREPAGPTSPAASPSQAVAQAMYAESLLGPARPRRSPTPRTATARACSPCTTPTTSASPTARGATSSRRSSRSRAWTAPSARRSRRTTPSAASSTRSRRASPRARPATTCARSSRRRSIHASTSPAPAPGRSSSIGTTGDPATPLDEHARRWPTTLEDGRLVVVTADQHTGYSVNDCVDDVVHDYLIDLEVPADETEC